VRRENEEREEKKGRKGRERYTYILHTTKFQRSEHALGPRRVYCRDGRLFERIYQIKSNRHRIYAVLMVPGASISPQNESIRLSTPPPTQRSMSLLDLDDVDELLDQLDAVTTEGLTEALHPPDPPEASHSQTPYRQLAPAPVRNTSTSTARMPAREGATSGGGRRPCPQPLTEQERLLPMANVGRIMAMQLAKDAKISRDAKVLMQEIVSEFICFVSSESVDLAIEENSRTITREAILGAMSRLDFDSFLLCLDMMHSHSDEGASTSSDSKPAPPMG
jgi:histone H3/H4